MIRRALAMAVVVLGVHTAAAAPETDNQPYVAMRTLQNLQEQMAHGNATAQAAQPQLMAHIAEGFLAADLAVWKDARNARAGVLFLLSGGRPAVIRTILARTSFPADLDRLLKGALAYGEGEDEIARTLFEPLDPQAVPSALGAHFALVKANLLAEQSPAKAIKLFDTARLLAPGTLIEEAALRREVFALVDAGSTAKAMLLARQYLRRFKTSSYAGDFKQRFAATAVAMATSGDVVKLTQLDTVLNELPVAETRAFYLSIARSAAMGGRTAETRVAAEKVLTLANPGSIEETRALLYRATSLVVSDDPGEGLRALAMIEPAKLSPTDATLRTAAIAVGNAIEAEARPQDGEEPGVAASDSVQATIERARTLLVEADTLLAAHHP